MTTTYTVTMPDGTTFMRNSKRAYTHALIRRNVGSEVFFVRGWVAVVVFISCSLIGWLTVRQALPYAPRFVKWAHENAPGSLRAGGGRSYLTVK